MVLHQGQGMGSVSKNEVFFWRFVFRRADFLGSPLVGDSSSLGVLERNLVGNSTDQALFYLQESRGASGKVAAGKATHAVANFYYSGTVYSEGIYCPQRWLVMSVGLCCGRWMVSLNGFRSGSALCWLPRPKSPPSMLEVRGVVGWLEG